MPHARIVRCLCYDQADYQTLWDLQRALVDSRQQQLCDDQIIFAEHTPVYTIGRSGSESEILRRDPAIPIIRSDRGGRVTYHGPGQLMVYLVWDISGHSREVRQLVRQLEEVVQRTLAPFGIRASSDERRPGLWVGRDKIAAIGLRITRGVVYHGLAINRDPDLAAFANIIPCGIRDGGVTSMARLGVNATRPELERQLIQAFETTFAITFDRSSI
ncbi:MAG: lipoyl(octanoyl) transferase LipB [Magnetococcales bacterium]|nr:lipoyl(octanoyl) transferase LipB [Magnetococcales bacterium]